MKKEIYKILVLTLVLASCGERQFTYIDAGDPNLIPVEMLNDPFESALSNALNAELDFSEVKIFDAPRASMAEICGNDAPACASGIQNVIVHTDPSNCTLMMHEFAHIALYQLEGHIYADHNHEIFNYEAFQQLCADYDL